MRRFLLSLPVALGVLAGALGGGPARAADRPSKSFAEHNFEWTLPSETWQFQEMSADQRAGGYVAGALGHVGGGAVSAYVRVAPTNDLSLDEMTEDVRNSLQGNPFDVVERTGKDTGKLSGLAGTLVVGQGKARGNPVHVRVWTVQAEGKFHQLFVQSWGEAIARGVRDVDALRRGYRLLEGAGPVEPEPVDDGTAPAEEPPKLEEGSGWPAGGPRREGNKITLPSHNMSVTIPEGSPLQWTGSTVDEKKLGVMAIATGKLPSTGKSADGKALENTCRVIVAVLEAEPGFDSKGWVQAPNIQNSVQEGLKRVDINRTKAIAEYDVGNIKGSALQVGGWMDDVFTIKRIYIAGLKGKRYQFEATLQGGQDVDDAFKAPLQKFIEGVNFPDTVEPVHGPLGIPGIPDSVKIRGFGVGEEKEETLPGLTIKKPKELSIINFKPGEVPDELKLAAEWRSADGLQYLYFDVSVYRAEQMQQSKTTPESFASTREGQWTEHAGGSAVTKKGKELTSKAEFAKAKGVGYRFTGSLGDAPFVERGYVVKNKQSWYWVRVQFGGKDAEKALDKMAKAVEKGFKFTS